jgi:hypothetical protein
MPDVVRVFAHHLNGDGTYDAICPDCFKTVSTERLGDRLISSEKAHFCSLGDLEQLWGSKRAFR